MRNHIRAKKGEIFGNNKILPCVFCGFELDFDNATVEHIIPLSNGGNNRIENLTISCKQCNNNRKSIPFEEWKVVINNGIYKNDNINR